MKEESW